MGFFKDFKRDFAQAVNELMPDQDELAEEYDDEDMVNTFDEMDNMDIAPEDMLDELDDFSLDNISIEDQIAKQQDNAKIGKDKKLRKKLSQDAASLEEDWSRDAKSAEDVFRSIPNAEVINDVEDQEIDTLDETEEPEAPEMEVLTVLSDEEDSEPEADELVMTEELDETNMLENVDEALKLDSEEEVILSENVDEPEKMENLSTEGKGSDYENNRNLNEDVLAAVEKYAYEANEPKDIDESDFEESEEESMAEVEARIQEGEQDIDSILSDDTTYITKGTTIKGDIQTDGGIDIIGSVEGAVSCGGKLILGGSVKGNVKAGEVYANAAKIEGNVDADNSAKIGVGSVVVGNISAQSAVIAGAVHGDIDVHGPVIVDSTAVIMGNIKSRSVQINNGAVIEGFCSQCYSEIDVKSFFA